MSDRTREELATVFRVFARLGWDELVFTHVSARVAPGRFLMNPFGLRFGEITPDTLVEVDADGGLVAGDHPANPAGFVIHGAIHAARPDAHWVMHTHTTAGMAVAGTAGGLRPESLYAAQVVDDLAVHPFEGVTTRMDERARIVADLGRRSFLLLEGHGLLVVGADAAEAFARLWTFQRACEVQVAMAGSTGIQLGPEVRARAAEAAFWRSETRWTAFRALAREVGCAW